MRALCTTQQLQAQKLHILEPMPLSTRASHLMRAQAGRQSSFSKCKRTCRHSKAACCERQQCLHVPRCWEAANAVSARGACCLRSSAKQGKDRPCRLQYSHFLRSAFLSSFSFFPSSARCFRRCSASLSNSLKPPPSPMRFAPCGAVE